MKRRFPIADLRTLAARALQFGTYTPSDSGRIRAVPDTRTIRYYTTLGLINRPSEMRGRTALYDENHVLQLVAIKRLQANNQTLSDIQSQLVGIAPNRLKKLADLPNTFWQDADRYLASRDASSDASEVAATEDENDFWTAPAALPPSIAGAGASMHVAKTCTRMKLHAGVQLIVDATEHSALKSNSIDMTRLQGAAAPLLEELRRQGLLTSDHRGNPETAAPQGPDTSQTSEETS